MYLCETLNSCIMRGTQISSNCIDKLLIGVTNCAKVDRILNFPGIIVFAY